MPSEVEIIFPDRPLGDQNAIDTVAELRALDSTDVNENTNVIVAAVAGIYKFSPASLAADDGTTVIKPDDLTSLQAGRWLLIAFSTTSLGFTSTGTGSRQRTAATVMDEFVHAGGFTDYDETGATDSYSAIMYADLAGRTRKRTVIFPGTPKSNTPIVLLGPTNWRMQGSTFKPGFPAGPYFIKPASMNGTFLTIPPAALKTQMDGIAIRGEVGNTGNGIDITGDMVTLNECGVDLMGQDGVRVGSAAAGAFNADGFVLNHLSVGYNVRHGLYIDDQSGTINANAGNAAALWSCFNGGDGLKLGIAKLGTVFTGGVIEQNTGYGINLGTDATQNVFIGGNVEVNTAGNLNEVVPFGNRFYETVIGGVRYSNFEQRGSFTPTVEGETAAGVGTYTARKGRYAINGGICHWALQLDWSAHTGTGNMLISGFPFSPTTVIADMPDFIPCSGWSSGITLGADAQLVFGFSQNQDKVYVFSTALGVPTQLAMDSAAIIRLSGFFFLSLPE